MTITTVSYGQTSPYYSTQLFDNRFLDVLNYRAIPKLADDKVVTISTIYHLRPDLMAYDLYGNAALWWVFAARNPNTLLDPLWNFTAGTVIFLPQKQALTQALGV